MNQMRRHNVADMETVLWFGKWKNRRVKIVCDIDPGYLVWAADEGILLFDDETYATIQRATEAMNDNSNYRED